jgi:cytoskeletal protein CcmA (bactofilin family)
MFRRNNSVSGLQASDNSQVPGQMNELPLRPAQPQSQPAAAPAAAPAAQSLTPRPVGAAPAAPATKAADLPVSRFGGIPGVMPRRVGGAPEASASENQGLRKLIVGREISLSGDITACDILVVEGNIEATLRDGRHLEITEAGHFKGSVEIDEADIAGKFEGNLTVRGRLKMRSTGHIEGTLSYGELEVEAGGRIVGEMKVLPQSAQKLASKELTASGAQG